MKSLSAKSGAYSNRQRRVDIMAWEVQFLCKVECTRKNDSSRQCRESFYYYLVGLKFELIAAPNGRE